MIILLYPNGSTHMVDVRVIIYDMAYNANSLDIDIACHSLLVNTFPAC